jgi:hypothetical protein
MDALAKLRNIFSLIAILVIAALVIAIAVLTYLMIAHPQGTVVVVGAPPVR